MIRYLFILFITLNASFAQDTIKTIESDSINDEYFVFEGDSLLLKQIELDEVYVLKNIEFESKEDRIRYLILKRKVRKVYPYAKLAADKLTELTKEIDLIKGKRAKKRYTKKVQKYIEEEFSKELKKLTRTEGQILVKLIHRQTGVTAFNLVKELRSGWRAFWYNSTATLFNISLKREFVPLSVREDYYIEDILQRAFKEGFLERQNTVLDFDYLDIVAKWNKD